MRKKGTFYSEERTFYSEDGTFHSEKGTFYSEEKIFPKREKPRKCWAFGDIVKSLIILIDYQ